MYKICVFAGTTEGRELVEFLSSQPVAVTACVATEYGETLLPAADNRLFWPNGFRQMRLPGCFQTHHLI